MPRSYKVSFSNVAVTAAQDLFEILAASEQPYRVDFLHLSQYTDLGDAAAEGLLVTIRRVTGAPTSGSGGTVATARPNDEGDTAFGGTCEVNNTTQLSGGTNVILHSFGWNIAIPEALIWTPEQTIWIRGSTRLLVELETAPTESVSMSGTLGITEIG